MFEVENGRIIRILERELESYKSFQANIDAQIERLRSNLNLADSAAFAESLRYNKDRQRHCLERAAAALEVIGRFDENKGDVIDYDTISKKCIAVQNAPKSRLALRMRLSSIGKTLEEALGVAKEFGFENLRDMIPGITKPIDEFINEMHEDEIEDDEPGYALYGSCIVHLTEPWDLNAEIYELE